MSSHTPTLQHQGLKNEKNSRAIDRDDVTARWERVVRSGIETKSTWNLHTQGTTYATDKEPIEKRGGERKKEEMSKEL